MQSDVASECQILLLGSQHLEARVGANSLVKGYPKTDTENPIFLYSIDNNNVTLPNELDLPKFPSFPSSISVENDASLAKIACRYKYDLHVCKAWLRLVARVGNLLGYRCNVLFSRTEIVLIAHTECKLIFRPWPCEN